MKFKVKLEYFLIFFKQLCVKNRHLQTRIFKRDLCTLHPNKLLYSNREPAYPSGNIL